VSSNLYLKTMNQHVKNKDTVSISWCNFSYADKNETASALKPGSCYSGLWNNTTQSGEYIKYWIIKGEAPIVPVTLVSEIDSKKGIEFSVSPNPATGNMTLCSNIDEDVTVHVFNLSGDEVLATITFRKNITVAINQLVRGTYILYFNAKNIRDYRFLIKE